MIISVTSKRTPPPPRQGTFNHRLRPAGALLAVFAVSLLLIACPSPGGGGGTNPSDGGGGGTTAPDGGTPTPPAPEPGKPTPEPPTPGKPTPEPPTPRPKQWHVSTFAGSGRVDGEADGTGTSASFSWPFSIAQSGAALYVTDRSWHSIRTIDTTTARVDTIVSNGGNGLGGGYATGNGTTARFNGPSGIVAADAGTLYVADSNNHRIRKVTIGATAAATQVDDFAGSGTPGDAIGPAATAQFRSPTGLAIRGTTLYVAEYNGHRIRAIDLASGTVSPVAGNGSPGDADGAGNTAQFRSPAGLAISGTKLYVAEYNGHRIRAIDLTSANNTVSTIAGSGTAGYAPGTGTAAQFDTPIGIAISGGTLYAADYKNHRIRAIDLASGTVRDIAGDGTPGSGNGIGTAARFNRPTGIIAVGENTLYVATEGRRIRKLEYR